MGQELSFAGLADDEFAIGLDVGGTKTLGVAVGPDGRVLVSSIRATIAGESGVADGIAATVADLVDRVSDRRAASVGIGVPGIVDAAAGVVEVAVNVRLERSPLAALVRGLTGVPAAVENDVAVAALGEARLVPGAESLALISIGTGLAVGLVSHGSVTRGESAAAGEIGHLSVDPDGPWCGCGQRGCLELYLSGSGIARMWPEGGPHAAAGLASAVARADPRAVEVLAEVVDRLAWAIQLLALTVDPQRVLVGGGVAGMGDALFNPLRSALDARSERSPFVSSLKLSERVQRASGPEAAAVGAALHGLRLRPSLLVI
ncbi:MAG: ROK family protein [Microbacterium sp.]|uniref:ROK family protein n=1 Tax=Microbacterium sp. TaxID=51671 RepID=UPI003D6E5437